MPQPIIFLDDGGVMNDNLVRAPQWQVMVGEFFAPRLGGAPEAWAAANRTTMDKMFDPVGGQWQARIEASPDYPTFDAAYQLDWLGGMCQSVGVPMPDRERAIALAHQASAHICPRVRSAFPGAADAILSLHAQGFTLYTASGESSRELAGYLESMGVRHCFTRLYGPDLINQHKSGPAYYTRLLAHAGVQPPTALFVDDTPKTLAWIAQAGARPLRVDPTRLLTPDTIPSLAHLPAWLAQFA